MSPAQSDQHCIRMSFMTLTTLCFHYITVACVPYDFNVLRNVDHDPLVSFEIPLVGHDLNF